MNRFLILLFSVFYLPCIKAQEPKFIQHDVGSAYADIPLNVMLQDHQGMIWLGTNNGLARYDGNSWYPVRFDSSASILSITSLYEDKSGRIWIGTQSGKIYFLDNSRKVQAFDIEEGHPVKPITTILQDSSGRLWFATYGEGVYVYTGKRLFNFDVGDGLSGNDIYSMISTGTGEIWLGTDDGINICTFENEVKKIRSLGLADGLPDQIITALRLDGMGNIWIGTFEYGVVVYDAMLKKITKPFENQVMDEITSFEIFNSHEIWIGTRSMGVWRYNFQFKSIRKLVSLQALAPFAVSDILADIEGNIWISTNEGTLMSAFNSFESLNTEIGEIQTLFCDHQDKLWIGTIKGLYKLEQYADKVSKTIRVAPGYDFNTTNILEDNFNNLWIATLDKGLFIYTPSTGVVKPITSSVKDLGSSIMSMDRTTKEIYIGTLQGVVSYPVDRDITKEKNILFHLLSDPWQSNLHFVYQVFVDSRDRAWFATDGNGVYCVDGDQVTQYNGNDSVNLRKVYSICEDQQKHIWLNTKDLGLVELDGMTYKPLGLRQGLSTMNVTSIAATRNGDILISHHRGIDLMEPERRHFMYYSSEIGAGDFEPGDNAVATDTKGNVFIGGKNRIMKYYAADHEFTIDPRTQITQVRVNQQPIDFTDEHVFSFHENYFSFEYVGLWYTAPYAVTYNYKLIGYDREAKISKDNIASYSSLPPGDYTFLVKASENKSFFDEPVASYSFTIAKPFWWQLWFIGTILFLAVGIFYWLDRMRSRRVQRQALLKKEMIESQLQALKAQINPHFLFNSFNTLITIIDENTLRPAIAIEYVEKLSDFFRSILQYREQETIALEEEFELVQNFGYLLTKRYGTNLILHIDSAPKEAFILPLTLQMLVENAVKHNVIAENKPLDVFITVDEDQYITVKNNLQPKSKTEPSTQFGLQSIVRRYQLLSERKVIIEKDKDTFRVRIPIIKKSTE
ncbi:MAG TPA: two-component regulator propeller domain-containing protein [Saprospiraceae bacterium]|nr:two-component regulator propeller domain-containing protein [Saprospiraceae bacterium]